MLSKRAVRENAFRKAAFSVFLITSMAPLAWAGSDQAQTSSAATTTTGAQTSNERTIARPKSFDPTAMDTSANPCEDFYQYACGGWRKNNPIPSDQARWGRFSELTEYNRQVLRKILEKAADPTTKRDTITQKIGDLYASCMDEAALNKSGSDPLKPILERIDKISSKDQLMEAVAYLHGQGMQALFHFDAQPDLHDATMEMAGISQGGLGLPDRDYYLKDDAKSQETRQRYKEHVARMFVLLGDEKAIAEKKADAVMNIETKLAAAEFDRTKMRDPVNRDHKMKTSELSALAPQFEFQRFFVASGAPAFSEVNVAPPDFFQQVNGALDSISLADWKTYLSWHALTASAAWLSSPFVDENFSFFGHYLNGQQEIQPRWKRCVQLTDRALGEALGQVYIDQNFSADEKEHMLKMISALDKSLGQDIQELPWMTAETKKQAETKLQAISRKIGYPEKWRDYSTVKIVRGDLLGDIRRADAFESKRDLNKIGKPLDKAEWDMTPPTVNAYYNSSENDINFPAGILQPPFFDPSADDAVNLGGIGVVIGHEMTHGFDDQGSKYDAKGNLNNWWTDADRAEFKKRTECIANEYESFSPIEDVHLNGHLTLGENTADNGGARIAFMALEDVKTHRSEAETAQTKDGFTPEQRFFLSFAQVWCENRTPENSRVTAKTDPHSPGRFRVTGTLQNNADFAKAFGCKPGQKMVSENACRVW